MLTVDAGSPLLIEVEFLKTAPFKGYKPFDPTTNTFAIYGPDGIALTDENAAGSLTKVENDAVDAGRFYCIIQTVSSWSNGNYTVRVSSAYGTAPDVISDVDVKDSMFTLQNSVPEEIV